MKDNNSFNDFINDFESWEPDFELIQNEDYDGLIKHRKAYLEEHPNDEDAKWRLGEAYILAKEFQKALDYFKKIYKEVYENPNVQASILDALFGIGKNENDFEWIEKPDVLRIEEAIELCKEFLKGKRKHVCIADLYNDLLMEGYLNFDESELYKTLRDDDLFEVKEDCLDILSSVKLKKKRK